MAFNTNFINLMNGYTALPTTEGGGDPPTKKPVAYIPPDGYKPSTPEQRSNWNQFLDFLETKGVGGSAELDRRDTALGRKYLAEFNKTNPKAQIPESFVPTAQYESYLIRKKGEFPGLAPEKSKYAFGNLPQQFKDRAISDVDSWLGSYTSKQYYPNFSRGTSKTTATGQNVTTGAYDFGTDFNSYVDSLNDPILQEKFKKTR